MDNPQPARQCPSPGDIIELRVWRFTGSVKAIEQIWALGWVYDVEEDGTSFVMRFEDERAYGASRVILVRDPEWRQRGGR